MEVRKGYKQTEVGVIPEDWVIVRIGDLLNGFQNGYAFSAKEYISVGMPIITMAQIGLDGTFQFSETSVNKWEIEKAKKLKDYFVSDGDVIISMTDVTPGKNLIGRMAITKLETPALLNQRVGLLRLNREKIVSGYLVPLSNQKIWRNYCKAVSSLGVQANIGTKDIKNGYIPLPSTKVEQEAIAEALSDADALIESLEKLITKNRNIKQAAMQQLLTGKKRLPGFSGKWTTKKLGKIADIIMGQSPKSAFYNTKGDGLPLIQGNADIKNRKTIIRVFTSVITKKGFNGNVIMSVRAPVGEIARAIFDCCLGRGVCAISYKNDFLYHCLIYLEKDWVKLSKGSTFDSINSKEVYGLEISMPPSDEEQTAIAQILSDMDAEIEALEKKRDKYKTVKQGMMQELLTGKTRLI